MLIVLQDTPTPIQSKPTIEKQQKTQNTLVKISQSLKEANLQLRETKRNHDRVQKLIEKGAPILQILNRSKEIQ